MHVHVHVHVHGIVGLHVLHYYTSTSDSGSALHACTTQPRLDSPSMHYSLNSMTKRSLKDTHNLYSEGVVAPKSRCTHIPAVGNGHKFNAKALFERTTLLDITRCT